MYIWRWWLGFGCWPCWIMFTYSKMEVIPKHLFDCCSVNSFTAGLSNSSDINILFYSASWSKLSLPWGKFNEYFIILFCNSWCDSVFKWYLLSLHFVFSFCYSCSAMNWLPWWTYCIGFPNLLSLCTRWDQLFQSHCQGYWHVYLERGDTFW